MAVIQATLLSTRPLPTPGPFSSGPHGPEESTLDARILLDPRTWSLERRQERQNQQESGIDSC